MILHYDQVVMRDAGKPITGAIKKKSRQRKHQTIFASTISFALAILRTKRIAMNGVNGKTAESHEANRQFRHFSSSVKRDKQDLLMRQKTKDSENICREAIKGRAQSHRAKDKTQKAQKRLKA